MINEYRYTLEKGSRKHVCPGCHKKRFVRYIDTETGQYLPEQYGRCDRETECAYHINPYTDQYGKEYRQQQYHIRSRKPKPPPKPKTAFIPIEVLNQTLQGHEQNVFLQNLLHSVTFPFETEDVEKVVSMYYLGTICNGYRAGAITFPFIDKNKKIHAIQVKQFDRENRTTGTDFLHSIIEKHHQRKNEPLPRWLKTYQKNEKKVSCLFGEHLLDKYPFSPVALVEAPKTAIYGTLYFGFPEQPGNFLWLAVYNLSSLNLEKCQALQSRDVCLFPDLSKDGTAFDLWSSRAKELEKKLPGTRFNVSDLLERKANTSERAKGLDLADYLIKHDWQKFRSQPGAETEQATPETTPEPITKSEKGEKSEAPKKTFLSGSDKANKFPAWETLDDASKSFWNSGGRGGEAGYTAHENRMLKYKA